MSNGRRLHPRNIDGRSTEARRFRDLVESFADGLGGLEGLTEAERSLVRGCALLTVEAERMQAQAAGEAVDLEQLTRVSNAQTRVLRTLQRGKATPSLQAYLASKASDHGRRRGGDGHHVSSSI